MKNLYYIITALSFIVYYLFKTVLVVQQSSAATKERFGKLEAVLEPGLHFIFPLIDVVRGPIDLREKLIVIKRQKVITKDNAPVEIDGVAFFSIIDVSNYIYTVEDPFESIEKLASTGLRTVVGALEIDEVLSERKRISVSLLKALEESVSKWGVKVTRVEIQDIILPANISAAMSKQLVAERDRRAAILQAEGAKQASILVAEGQAVATITTAKAEKERIQQLAIGEQDAIKLIAESIDQSKESGKYNLSKSYIEAFGKIAQSDNTKLLLAPSDSLDFLGSFTAVRSVFDSKTPTKHSKQTITPEKQQDTEQQQDN